MDRTTALVAFLVVLASAECMADSLPAGAWTRRAIKDGRRVTMLIEGEGAGRTITYDVELPDGNRRSIVVLTQRDGKDAPVSVDGRSTNQTMAFRAEDDRRVHTISKMNGKQLSTQTWEVSEDGKVIKVENFAANADGKTRSTGVDYWDRKE